MTGQDPTHRQHPSGLPTPHEPTSSIVFGPHGLRAGWGLLLFLILLAAYGFVINSLAAARVAQPAPHAQTGSAPTQIAPTLFLSEGTQLLAVLLATFTMAYVERRPLAAYGLGNSDKLSHFLQGLFWGGFCLSLLVATLRLTRFLHFDALLLHGPSAFRFALIWAAGFTAVSFLEETLLRGYLQTTLTRGLSALVEAISDTPHRHAYSFWTAALILSFVFGLGHRSNPGESPIGLLAAGCAGLVFSLALYRTGSLWWALGAHAAWDWAQSFLYGVADSGLTVQHHLLATHPLGAPILSGGGTGPEGSLFVLPTLALLATIILLTLKPRPDPL